MAIDSTLVTAAAASATNFSPLLISVGFGGSLFTITNTLTNSTTATGGIGGGHTTAAASLLPAITNLGIPLTGSMATGFPIGIMKG